MPDIQSEKSEESKRNCSPCEKGTTNLIAGAGIGAYGTASFLATGVVCPACVILTPALLALGAYKRSKFLKAKKGADTPS